MSTSSEPFSHDAAHLVHKALKPCVDCEGSKVDFHSDNISSRVLVFENALVKMLGSVANIIHVAQVT